LPPVTLDDFRVLYPGGTQPVAEHRDHLRLDLEAGYAAILAR
jgi:hypothetical protein